jgi:hypothetical protein
MFSVALLASLLLGAGPAIGSEVRMMPGPNADGCFFLIDGVAYVAFARHWKADDPEGLGELILEGRAALVPKGLKVRVVEYHPGFEPPAAEVRILEGKHKSRLVWIPTFYLPD